jgi:hypothetical protein
LHQRLASTSPTKRSTVSLNSAGSSRLSTRLRKEGQAGRGKMLLQE